MILTPVISRALFMIVLLATVNLSCTSTHSGMGLGKAQSEHESLKEKYQSVIRNGFTTYDADGSGFLSRPEYSEFQLDPEVSKILTVIARYNKSGTLLFEDVDENSDGRINIEEIQENILSLLPAL